MIPNLVEERETNSRGKEGYIGSTMLVTQLLIRYQPDKCKFTACIKIKFINEYINDQ